MFTAGCCLVCLSIREKVAAVTRNFIMHFAIKRAVRNWEVE